MSATKTDTALVTDGYSISAGNTGYTSSTATLTTSYGAVILLTITNSGTQTAGVTAQIQCLDSASNIYQYGGALTAGLTTGASYSWVVPIAIPCQYVNVLFVGATGNAATLHCHIETVTKI
jgi:hypothetical protein